MKRIAVVLALLTTASGMPPAVAAALEAPVRTSLGDLETICEPTRAVWRPQDTTFVTDVQDAVWQCRVGSRRLVVRYDISRGPGGRHRCDTAAIGSVSAWVTGVKAVYSEPIGDLGCPPSIDLDTTPVLVSITLDKADGLTVCHLQGRVDQPTKVCKAVRYGGRRDPAYRPPGS